MNTGILITNGGAHTHDDWAIATASMILSAFEVKPGSPNRARLEAAKARAQAAVTEVMVEYHETVQRRERESIRNSSAEHVSSLAEHIDVDEVVGRIHAALSPLLGLVEEARVVPGPIPSSEPLPSFDEQVLRVVRERVMTDMSTVMEIERSWERDRSSAT